MIGFHKVYAPTNRDKIVVQAFWGPQETMKDSNSKQNFNYTIVRKIKRDEHVG